MTECFWTEERSNALDLALRSEPQWARAIRYFSGRIRLTAANSSIVIAITPGSAKIAENDLLETNAAITGPIADWKRIASGELDWFQASTPGFGTLSVDADPVFIARNIKIFWLIFVAIASSGGMADPIHFSPPSPIRILPTASRYIEIDGLEVYVEEAGEGPAILCLHAACQDTLMYRHVLAGLSDRYRVIALDAPGHGKSQMPANGPFTDLATHAAFNERAMEIMGLERPVIIGCSMGGNMVLELAARRPGAYAAVISSEGADFTPGLDAFTLDMMLLNGQELLECYSQSLTGRRTPPDRAREVIWQIRRTVPEVMRADLGSYSGFDVRNMMGAITDPVLLLRGTDDWLVSQEQVEATAARIANSQIGLLAGTGHYPMIENPTEFNEAVCNFLHGIGIS